MDYTDILETCIGKIEEAKAMDGDSYNPDNYRWLISCAAADEILRGLGLSKKSPVPDELFGICVTVIVLPEEVYTIQLYKEVK